MADEVRQKPSVERCATLAAMPLLLWVFCRLASDRWWLTGLVAYLPAAAILLGQALVAIAFAVGRAWRCALLFAISATVLAGMWIADNSRLAATPGEPEGLSVLHWNVLWLRKGKVDIVTQAKAWNADLMLLSEVTEDIGDADFADHKVLRLRTMLLVARGEIRDLKRHSRERPDLYTFVWESARGPVRVLAADVSSALGQHRLPVLERIRSAIESEQPDIILGDFNTPRHAYSMRQLTAGYRHAYEIAGAGIGYTWPESLPLMALDHCLVSGRVEVQAFSLHSSDLSDHRAQQLWFEQQDQM